MKSNFDTSKLLKEIFKNNWDKEFIFDALTDNTLSYGDFFNTVLNCKETLKDIGLKRDDTICLLMHNSLDLMVLYFTSLLMQITVVPVDPYKGEEDIKDMLLQTNYNRIICDAFYPDINFLHNKIYIGNFRDAFYNKKKNDIDGLNIFDTIDYNGRFLITFTSGSTGIPKGVMHPFNNLVLSAIAFRKRFNFGKENTFYHNLPMTYMAGILNLIILPLISGSKIVIGERFNISNIMRFWETPIKYSVNTFWFIPTIITLLLKLDRGTEGIEYTKKSESKIIGCVGTAHLHPQAKQAFQKRYNIPLYESYGLSETLFVTTNYPGKREIKNSVGDVLEGVELSFSKDNEILIGVPWMFLGYLNVNTESYFENRKFRSGDLGIIDENGFLMITGRKKDLIIKGGINISPKKIEDFISTFNIFEESAIIGIEDVNLGEKIVCFFVPDENSFSEDKKKELNRAIIKKLGSDYRIDEFVQIDAIPKITSGKIDKQKIKKIYKDKGEK